MIFGPVEKLLWHGDRIKRWLESDRSLPILVEIAPTAFCNASCPWCFFKDRKSDAKIDSLKMMEIIEDLALLGVKAINWTGGGEPTLHPHFKDFVERAFFLGIEQGIFTNGLQEIPHQDKFEWIRISLTDAGLKKTIKPKVPFGICINQTKLLGETDLRMLCLQARGLGSSYLQVRPALIGDHLSQPELEIPVYLKEYEKKGFEVYLTEYKYRDARQARSYDFCYGYNFCPSIDWEGMLSTCLYLSGDKRFILGDLKKDRILDIWPEIAKKIPVVPECQNCCKNHEINKILDRAKKVKMVNFP